MADLKEVSQENEFDAVPLVYVETMLEVLVEHNESAALNALSPVFARIKATGSSNVSIADYLQCLGVVSLSLNDRRIGLKIGESSPVTTHGLLSNLLISAPSLQEALGALEIFYCLRMPLVSVRCMPTAEGFAIEVVEGMKLPEDVIRFFYDLLLGAGNALIRFYSGEEKNFIRTYLPIVPESTVEEEMYAGTLGGKVCFDQKSLKIIIPKNVVAMASPMANKELFNLSVEQCRDALGALEKEATVGAKIVAVVKSDPSIHWTIDKMAKYFGMSVSTFQRALKKEKTKYKPLVTNARYSVAMEWLENGTYSVDEIAYRLGFSHASNFSSSFRIWAGKPPSHFRKKKV